MHKRVSKNVLPIPKHVSDRESATRSSLARLVVGGGEVEKGNEQNQARHWEYTRFKPRKTQIVTRGSQSFGGLITSQTHKPVLTGYSFLRITPRIRFRIF